MSSHRPSYGIVGALSRSSTAELQIRRGKDMMSIGTTDSENVDRGWVDVHDAQGRGGQDAAANSSASALDLTGDMAVVR